MKPGVYPGLSFEEYLAIDAAHFSLLKLFERSAAHAHEEIVNPRDPGVGMLTGSAFHSAILEPREFDKRFVIHPEIKGKRADKRTKAGKLAWAEHEDANQYRDTLTRAAYESAKRAAVSVWKDPVAAELLGGQGANEVSIVWIDKETGLLCKARPDRLTMFGGWTCCVDLKKTQNAQRFAFEKAASDYRYHEQAAFYLDGLFALDPRDRIHRVLAIEEKPPHGIGVFDFDDDSLDAGRVDYRAALKQLAKAKETGNWPNYESGSQIVRVRDYLLRR